MTVSDGSRTRKTPAPDAPSPRVLAWIAARARPLHERIAMTRGRAEHRPAPPLDAQRRGRWRAAAARGVEVDFVQRLDHAGLVDPDDLADVLAEPEPDPTAGIPAWLEVLVAAAGRSGAPEPAESAPTTGHELDRLLAPLLEEAQVRLTQRAPQTPDVSAVVANDLAEGLRRDLSHLAGPCVDTEFAAFRTRAGQVVPDDLWRRFEREALASGLFGIWDTYPVLARLVGVRLLDWVDRSGEMLERFEADRTALAEFFAINEAVADAPRLETVELTGSDPHNGHAQVAVCTVSGTRVVYKPKDVSAEALLAELVGWFDRIGVDLGPATEVLARDGYGWVGYIEQAPVDTEGARRFYARIGRLAALLFALGGNDAHAENVVACGDAPVVIDAETVLQPTLPAEDGRPIVEWVLDGLLLPNWMRVGGVAMDLSAAGAPGTTLRRAELHWQNPGTPQMELVPIAVAVGDFPSAVRAPTGDLYRPEDHAEEILSGFRKGWQQIFDRVSDFTGPGGWLDRLANVRVRVLVRITRTYTRLLDTALDPSLLRSGVERSIHLDHVARAMFDRDAQQWLGLADAERRMLEDGDVPFFSVRADEAALRSTEGGVLIGFDESSLARARRRLAALTDHDLELQSQVIRASLAAAPTGCRSKAFEAASCAHRSDTGGNDPAAAAAVVAARMLAQVTTFGGPSAPLGLVVASPSQWAIEVPGPGLYDGRIGLAVAFAGGAAALDDHALAELARQVAEPVLEDAVARPRRLVLGHGLGGQNGIGGILVGLALVQRITQAADPGLEAAFLALVRAVNEDDLDGADPLDLLAGLPGLVAGLAAGAQVGWQTETPIGAAARRRLMDAVAAQLAAVESGAAAARNGFAHGDSGLAALLAGVAALGTGASEEALALAAALVAAESARFDPELGGWRDLRPGADPGGLGPGWCTGSAGIALSRALVAQAIVGPAASDHGRLVDNLAVDLRRAYEGLGTDRLPRDTLCCGRAGRVAILQTISMSSAPDVEGRAHCRRMFDEATADLASAALVGELSLGAPPSPIAPLGLFEGLGGVLYALAQASRPDLPAVLAWGADLG
jgi:type 2 lantibiotic biosynthesis protein LanM